MGKIANMITVEPSQEQKTNHLVCGIINFLICPFGASMNILFIFIVSRNRRLLTKSNLTLVGLAAIDLLVTLIAQPMFAAECFLYRRNKFSTTLDTIVSSFGYTASAISFSTVIVIATERYLAVLHPFYYQQFVTKLRLLIFLIVVWISLLVISGTVLIFRHLEVAFWFLAVLCIVGLTWAIICYWNISGTAKRLIGVSAFPHERRHFYVTSKATATSWFVIGTITVCYLPFTIWAVVDYSCKSSSLVKHRGPFLLLWLQTLAILSSTINPIIYFWRLTEVRGELKRYLNKCFKKQISGKGHIQHQQSNNSGEDNRRKISSTDITNTLPSEAVVLH